MRKILSFLVVILVIAFPAFGAGTQEADESAGGEVEFNELGTYPIVDERAEVSILTYQLGDADLNNSWLTQHVEDLTNVDLVFELAPPDRFKEVMNLMFASGEYTDTIIPGGNSLTQLSRVDEMRLIQQGVVRPINDLIEDHSIWYKRRLDELDGFREWVTTPSGEIYDLAFVNSCYHCNYGQKLWLNEVWLDNLGLDVPTTVDEFTNVLRAFKAQDANGNGDPNDEWPLATSKEGAWVWIDGFLMNPFQFTDVGQDEIRRFYVDNGTIKASFMQPGYRDGLRYLHQLWEEELIFPDSFTQDRDTARNINQGGDVAVFGAVPSMHAGYYSATTGADVRYPEYMGLAPLDGPAGRQTPVYGNPAGLQYRTGQQLITIGARNPALVMRVFDFFYSDEGGIMGFYGQPGVSYRDGEAGDVAMNGEPARIAMLEVDQSNPYYGNFHWSNRSSHYRAFMSEVASAPSEAGSDLMPPEQFLWHWTDVNYAPYAVPMSRMVPPLFYDPESVSELAQIYATLDEFVYESVVRFVTGDLDIETEWSWFHTELREIGVDRFLEIVQGAYDSSAFAN